MLPRHFIESPLQFLVRLRGAFKLTFKLIDLVFQVVSDGNATLESSDLRLEAFNDNFVVGEVGTTSATPSLVLLQRA